jgi:hypothetical protein
LYQWKEGRKEGRTEFLFFRLHFVLRVEYFLFRLTVVVVMIILETELRARVVHVACLVWTDVGLCLVWTDVGLFLVLTDVGLFLVWTDVGLCLVWTYIGLFLVWTDVGLFLVWTDVGLCLSVTSR